VPQLRGNGAYWASGRRATGPVSRLRRFPDNRFLGRRDTMIVYDCDEPDQFDDLSRAATDLGLDARNDLQAFAPDTLLESSNRGFRPTS
jgi:hypothetical protein